MARVALVALATCLLTSCTSFQSLTAPPGTRPGVDVPTGPAIGADAEPLGRPALPPSGEGGYAFLSALPDGRPVTFDPCRPLHVVVRPAGAPPGARALLLEVLGELSAATGLQFLDDGATDEGPAEVRPVYQPERYGDRWAPILVTWSSPAETAMLTDGVLGLAGPNSWGRAEERRYVTGIAVFNGPALTAQMATGDDERARAVLLHELGHLVGLGHVTDPFQVMFDTNSYPLPRYRAGDLRGLSQLGLGGCFEDR